MVFSKFENSESQILNNSTIEKKWWASCGPPSINIIIFTYSVCLSGSISGFYCCYWWPWSLGYLFVEHLNSTVLLFHLLCHISYLKRTIRNSAPDQGKCILVSETQWDIYKYIFPSYLNSLALKLSCKSCFYLGIFYLMKCFKMKNKTHFVLINLSLKQTS